MIPQRIAIVYYRPGFEIDYDHDAIQVNCYSVTEKGTYLTDLERFSNLSDTIMWCDIHGYTIVSEIHYNIISGICYNKKVLDEWYLKHQNEIEHERQKLIKRSQYRKIQL